MSLFPPLTRHATRHTHSPTRVARRRASTVARTREGNTPAFTRSVGASARATRRIRAARV